MRTECWREHLDTRNRKRQEPVKWRNEGYIIYTFRSIIVTAIMSTKMEWEEKWRDTKCRHVAFNRKSQGKSAFGDLRSKTVDSHRICMCSPTDAIVRSRRSGSSRILCKSWLSTHVVTCIWMYKGVRLKSKLQYTGTRSAAAWPSRRLLCDCPAVFFAHCSFIPTRKNPASFKHVIVCVLTYLLIFVIAEVRNCVT